MVTTVSEGAFIHAGDCNSDYVEITEGLKPGDRLVVRDMEHYKTKDKLKIKWH